MLFNYIHFNGVLYVLGDNKLMMTMTTNSLHVKLPNQLDRELEEVSSETGLTKSEITRASLQLHINNLRK